MSKDNNKEASQKKRWSLFKKEEKEKLSIYEEEQVESPFKTMFKTFMSRKLTIMGLIGYFTVFILCMVLPIFYPTDLTHQDASQQNIGPSQSFMKVPEKLQGNVKMVDSGRNYSIGLDNNNQLYLWGNLSKRLKDVPAGMGEIVDVSAGLDHVLVRNTEGEVFTWGSNKFMLENIPKELEDVNIVKMEAGYQISIILDDEGNLHIWGNENIININTRNVQGRVKDFVSNNATALVILDDGTVECLATRAVPYKDVPPEIQGDVVEIELTDKAAAAVTGDGKVHVWGSAEEDAYNIPESIQGKTVGIEAGTHHFTALLNDGTIESWGGNEFGQGNSPSASGVVSINSDYFQNYALTEDGKLEGWGLKGYLMGTDQFGRDLFRRLIAGGRITLTVGIVSVIIAAVIGISVGGVSGYYGGKTDMILMRGAEIIQAIPYLPLAIILSYIVGNKISQFARVYMIMVIQGLLNWPSIARLVRGKMLSAKENEYVLAARAMGVRESAIIFKHIFPNIIGPIIVNLTIRLGSSMLSESTLSFLGFGIIEPVPTWGNMLNSCIDTRVITEYWWRWIFPGAALSIVVLSINVIGDGLRDAIDPRSAER